MAKERIKKHETESKSFSRQSLCFFPDQSTIRPDQSAICPGQNAIRPNQNAIVPDQKEKLFGRIGKTPVKRHFDCFVQDNENESYRPNH
uniref:hypothetical protein n=1 Tax=uncultured Draconibacterium sp. TaxID=1573823 RepID=UPI0032173F35